jgi:hypothetical protein
MNTTLPALTPQAFLVRLSALLREQSPGTAALIDEFCIAWFDGANPVLAYVREDDARQIDEEFDLADCEWADWHVRAQTWLDNPVYTDRYRAQLLPWIKKAGAARRTMV